MAEIIENSLNEAAEAVAAELPSPGLLTELFASPLNLALLGLCAFLLYKILQGRLRPDEPAPPREPVLPPLKRRDWTVEEIKPYDGLGPDGRILVAVNGKVFDMTKGKRFYGPGRDSVSLISSPLKCPSFRPC